MFEFITNRNCGTNCGIDNPPCQCANFFQEMHFSLLDNGKLFVSPFSQNICWQGDIQLKTHFRTRNGVAHEYFPTSEIQNENGKTISQNWELYITMCYEQQNVGKVLHQELPIKIFRDEV